MEYQEIQSTVRAEEARIDAMLADTKNTPSERLSERALLAILAAPIDLPDTALNHTCPVLSSTTTRSRPTAELSRRATTATANANTAGCCTKRGQ